MSVDAETRVLARSDKYYLPQINKGKESWTAIPVLAARLQRRISSQYKHIHLLEGCASPICIGDADTLIWAQINFSNFPNTVCLKLFSSVLTMESHSKKTESDATFFTSLLFICTGTVQRRLLLYFRSVVKEKKPTRTHRGWSGSAGSGSCKWP